VNFLEQLVAEWYAYKGYLVRTNVKFGKRARGGWEGEMDVLAFEPRRGILVHLETSGDADSWKERRDRFRQKFEKAASHYEQEFPFQSEDVTKIAVVGFARPTGSIDLGDDITLLTIPELMTEITKEIRELKPTKRAVDETYPLLRAIQFAVWYGSGRGDR
jgi:hypothetical protein